MTGEASSVELRVEGEALRVVGVITLTDRQSRLFFRSIMGGQLLADGWLCPRRNVSISTTVVRVNSFLESRGFLVKRQGVADQEIERELESRRSFARTREAATKWKAGEPVMDIAVVKRELATFGWLDSRPLKPHQEQGVGHALTAVNAANFSVPGSGKTLTALAVAATHLAANNIDVVLVVGPLACFRPWERETVAALGNRLRTRRVRGTSKKRRDLYAGARPGTLLMTSYASAAADRSAIVDLCRSHDVMLIVDESHRIKRFRGGLWSEALVRIAAAARIRMILSGTPMPQSGRDLFSQLRVLWPGGEVTGPRDAFAAAVETRFPSVMRDINPFVARTPKEALGLPPYEIHRHEVPLQPLQAEIYELIANGLRRRVAEADEWADKIQALRRARPIRLLQASSNPDLFNRVDSLYRLPRVEMPNPTLMDRLATYSSRESAAKLEFALPMIGEIAAADGKVVCWSSFVGNLDQFSKMVRGRLQIPCYQIDGRIPTGDDWASDLVGLARINPEDSDTRERLIDRFLSTDGPAVLVTNPASCSESISLHEGCHHAIYLDRSYDCAQFLQSIDRIHRLGLPPDVEVQIHILRATVDGQPTIDHLVDASLLAKENLMRQLLEGAELRPLGESADPGEDAEGDADDLAVLLKYLLGEDAGG